MNCQSFVFLRKGDGGRAAIREHRRGRTVDARVTWHAVRVQGNGAEA